jgi:hypothetical protein
MQITSGSPGLASYQLPAERPCNHLVDRPQDDRITGSESGIEKTSRKSAPRARFTSGGRIHPNSCR